MMKVFICPECGWMRVVSRRKDVECYKCGVKDMAPVKLDFAAFSGMSEEERKDYAKGWLYIHSRSRQA
jgi:transcription initiation factor TFIIIB Brf1 subunit/transcription initiation factor TFIIB